MRILGLLALLLLAEARIPPLASAEAAVLSDRDDGRVLEGVTGKKTKNKKEKSDTGGAFKSKAGWKVHKKKKAKKCTEDRDCLVNTGYCDEDACDACRSNSGKSKRSKGSGGKKKGEKKKKSKKGGKCKRGEEPRLCGSDPCTGLVPSCGPGGRCVLTEPPTDGLDVKRLGGEASQGCESDDGCKIDIGSCGEYMCKCVPLLKTYQFTPEEQCPGGSVSGCACARCMDVCGQYVPRCNEGTCDVGKPELPAQENTCENVDDCRLEQAECVLPGTPYEPCDCVPLSANQDSPQDLCATIEGLNCECSDLCERNTCEGYIPRCDEGGTCELGKPPPEPPVQENICENVDDCRLERAECVLPGTPYEPCECVPLSADQDSPGDLCDVYESLDCECADFCILSTCDGHHLTCEREVGEEVGKCKVSKIIENSCEDATECRKHRVKCVGIGDTSINPCECVALSQAQAILDCPEGDEYCTCTQCPEEDCDQYDVVCNDEGQCELTKP